MTRAAVSRSRPRAHAICDRCGFRYNHDELQWQHQWTGAKLQNLRILVCRSCLDIPQEQLRTIILPADPVPIKDPRPENYENANNPNSPIGQAPISELAGSNIGNLIQGGGTYSAFMGSSNKPYSQSAALNAGGVSFTNWVGKDWFAPHNTGFLPTTIDSTGVALVATSFEATAPTDAQFLTIGSTLGADWAFQGSSDATAWTTLTNGTADGDIGETVSASNLGGRAYRYHRFVISGTPGGLPVAVAKLVINTNRGINVDAL